MRNTSLHRFGIDPDGDPAAQWPKLCQLLAALVNNPLLHVGDKSSMLAIPTASVVGGVATPGARPPLFPVLIATEGSPTTYEVTVSRGYVLERLVVSGVECVVPHLPSGIMDTVDPARLKKHAITSGQWVMVTVHTLPSGAIGIEEEDPPLDPAPPPVLITIGDEESNHYEPPIGEGSEGAPGVYQYRLAQFDGDRLIPVSGVAGQHIDHWAELPTFLNAGGFTIWKEWDGAAGVYRTKGIEGIRQIQVEPGDNVNQVGGNDKNLKVRFIESGDSSPATGEDLNFEDGLNLDGTNVLDPVPNRDVILPVVVAGGGITVTRGGPGNRQFTVEADAPSVGEHLNLEIYGAEFNLDGNLVSLSPSPLSILYFRNGQFVGIVDPDGGVPPAGLITQEVTYATSL